MTSSRRHPETLVLVNPAAGGGIARRLQAAVASYLEQQNHRADFAESESTADLRARAVRGVQRGYRNIVAFGGDGTFHHLVDVTLGSGVALGFFPAGHGNDLASSLGIPTDAIAAASALLRSRPRRFDLARMRFPGINPGRLNRAAADRFPTAVIVGAGGIGVALELDGSIERDRALFVAVANAPYYGSGIRIAPAARMDDGLLDVVLVRPVDWTRMVDAIPRLLLSGDIRWSEVRRFRARHWRISTSRPAMVHSAGEIVGATPVEIELLPAAISIIVPNQSIADEKR